ncbi:MAG: periplasmic heavy metal sensor [Alphaproteobacteria bacterium]|nr:MAG: periplasmic heavy metal sensor [Alphaproteobacteria bacterium]
MKRLKTALLVSVALNIFLGGLLLGGKIASIQPPAASPVSQVLPAEKQAHYQEEMEKARQRFRAGREKYDALHAALMTAMEAEQFDRAAFDTIAADMLEERTSPLSSFLNTAATLAADMNFEERKAMAADIRLRYKAYRARKNCPDAADKKG